MNMHLFKSGKVLQTVMGWMLFFGLPVSGFAQSGILHLADSIVDDAFWGLTNDEIYWNNKRYSCSISPLHEFEGFDTLYDQLRLICETSNENFVDEKEYYAIWAILDNQLYLCNISMVCTDDYTHPTIETYTKAMMRGLAFKDLFLVRLFPLEELTGRRFVKKFPAGIYREPLGSGYVIPADWFDGVLEIHSIADDYFAPYQRLVFKSGRVVSVQQLIYYEWPERSKYESEGERW